MKVESTTMLRVRRPSSCLTHVVLFVLSAVCGPLRGESQKADAAGILEGTQALTIQGDVAAEMVSGIDRFLTRELEQAPQRRGEFWQPDYASVDAYLRSAAPRRERLRKLIGAVDPRHANVTMDLVAEAVGPTLVARGNGYTVAAVRWPVLEGLDGEGLLLKPEGDPIAHVIALPDADWTPEMLVGLASGIPPEAQFARRLAENNCEVLVPMLIDRADTFSGKPKVRMTNQPHREFVQRIAFQVGRTPIGYEVQKVLAVVDYFTQVAAGKDPAIAAIGYGEGGLLALYSAAIDPRIDAVAVCGYFQSRREVWSEPIYRNIWSLLREFGDAEIASLVAPRTLIIEACKGPEVAGPPEAREGRRGAAPGRLVSPSLESVEAEFARVEVTYDKLSARAKLIRVVSGDGTGRPGSSGMLAGLLTALGRPIRPDALKTAGEAPIDGRKGFDPQTRLHRQFDQMVEHAQRLARHSHFRREEFWSKANASTVARWQQSCRSYKQYLWEEVIGRLPSPSMPANPRTRQAYDEPMWRGYEVMLDTWPDVFAYGVLLVPKDLRAGERRPVVVCQHGLEGRPGDLVDPRINSCYHAFGAKLADRGFVVFAPQNPYIGGDTFRMLQRKANPLKLSLFSFIVGQHERTLDWLAGLPFVDDQRMAFYGLSYGGKTAVRVPPLLERYCLSICSGDFDEWILKTTTIDYAAGYPLTGEWEIPEFDLGHTFNHAELANLMIPRPFMVERGHDDGVALDEWVAWEYAKVRRRYNKMGIGDRTTIEYFNGPHEIHGVGTFEFLHRHLKWPTK